MAGPSIPSYNALASGGSTFAPSSLHFDAAAGDETAAKRVTFTSTGPDAVTFGTASLGGTSPTSFNIVADTCSTHTFTSGQTCYVDVTALLPTPGSQSATLNLTDDASGSHSVPLSATAIVGARGTYYPFLPQRIMDTRTGNGTTKAPIGSNGVRHLQVTGRGGVAATGVSAVVLNVTVVSPASSGYLTVYPTGVPRPTSSALNFAKGWTGANSVTVAVGTGGQIDIFNASSSADVIVDVAGFFAANDSVLGGYGLGGQFQSVYPERLFDSRYSGDGSRLDQDYFVSTPVDYGDENNSHIRAFAVNITAVSPLGSGYLTAWDGGDTFPSTSTLNFAAGKTVPNMAIVPAGPCYICEGDWYEKPSISIYTSQATHILVDIVGVFDDSSLEDGLRFTPITPTRIADTRTPLGLPGALGPNSTGVLTTPSSVITEPDTSALALNVTAVNPTASTWLTVWPNGVEGLPQPTISSLNPAKGQTVPNAVITVIGPEEAFNIYNNAGTTHVLIDVVGTFWLYPGTASSGFAGPGFGAKGPSQLRSVTTGGAVRHQR
ncbi:hypothetical protein F4553_004180 [Allocatelliglobosispora scoriae]|uniref:Choice-of-anchor D domain-containing protein n=1 Tax=Allocatelliglobosispora scoriae TaxID=643052 RepID=A0A841BVN1_9ACTN|nr:hypothetical protein [Allocatelliglobosispora scoriae]MBB5870801.1 hypothetical protein [Allocatelliglobosispora scoriae]